MKKERELNRDQKKSTKGHKMGGDREQKKQKIIEQKRINLKNSEKKTYTAERRERRTKT